MPKFIAQTEERCINCNEDIPAGATIYVNEFDGAVLCEMCKNGEKDLNYY